MTSWEYQLLTFDAALGFFRAAGDIDHDKATEALNALGAQGWELVSALDTQVSGGRTGRVTFVLKRPRAG